MHLILSVIYILMHIPCLLAMLSQPLWQIPAYKLIAALSVVRVIKGLTDSFFIHSINSIRQADIVEVLIGGIGGGLISFLGLPWCNPDFENIIRFMGAVVLG